MPNICPKIRIIWRTGNRDSCRTPTLFDPLSFQYSLFRKRGADQTFYRWKNRFDPYDLTTLEAASRRSHHVRKPLTPAPVEDRILKFRLQYPRWGKDKRVVLLKREGIRVSPSTVGRVMNRLKARGVLVEPLNIRQAPEGGPKTSAETPLCHTQASEIPSDSTWGLGPGGYPSDPTPE